MNAGTKEQDPVTQGRRDGETEEEAGRKKEAERGREMGGLKKDIRRGTVHAQQKNKGERE